MGSVTSPLTAAVSDSFSCISASSLRQPQSGCLEEKHKGRDSHASSGRRYRDCAGTSYSSAWPISLYSRLTRHSPSSTHTDSQTLPTDSELSRVFNLLFVFTFIFLSHYICIFV